MKGSMLAVLVCCLGGAAASGVQKVSVSMFEMGFKPVDLQVKAGVPVEITLTNSGKADHEFQAYTPPKTEPKDWDAYLEKNTLWFSADNVSLTIDGKAVHEHKFIEVALHPGQKAVLKFTPKVKGTFEMGCHEPGHYESGMKGKFKVN
ncbi:MAG: cupredoxin domain-containing protein [Deinococcaceae bacterium]